MPDYQKIDEFLLRSENIFETFGKEEGFKIISSEIDICDDKYLHHFITALNYCRNEKVLDWIEVSSKRIDDVSQNWGHLAASSQFNWQRAEQWLTMGRPLSLIALDALAFCTSIGERLNQSPWMREIRPKLIDSPRPDIIARRLQEYLKVDNVPRTRDLVNFIIRNIFETSG